MFCTNCGKKAEKGKFCVYCGKALRQANPDYENTNTLLRSNLTVSEISQASTANEPEGVKIVLPAVDVPDPIPVEPVQMPDPIDVEEIEVQPIQVPQIFEAEKEAPVETPAVYAEQIEEIQPVSTDEEEVPVEEPAPVYVAPVEETEPVYAEPVETEPEEMEADISYDSFTEMMSEPAEPEVVVAAEVPTEEPVPVYVAPVEEAEPVYAEPVEAEPEEIEADISGDSFAEMMNEPAEPEVIIVAPVEEPAPVYAEPMETAEAVQEVPEAGISYDNFAEMMSEPTEPEVIIVAPVEEPAPVYAEPVETVEEVPELVAVEEPAPVYTAPAEEPAPVQPAPEPVRTPETTISYSDIDPMFGPPPTIQFTAKPPQETENEKGGFFGKLFGKKNK